MVSVQHRDTEMVKGFAHLLYEKLRELGLFSLKRRKGILSMCINVYKELDGEGVKTEPGSSQEYSLIGRRQ